MDKRYEAFCQADPLFYDSPNNAPTTTVDGFAAGRELPASWQREELADWLLYAPVGGSLPQQGWKIHVSACRENAERILDRVWAYCVARGLPFKFLRDERALLLRNAKYAGAGRAASSSRSTRRTIRCWPWPAGNSATCWPASPVPTS